MIVKFSALKKFFDSIDHLSKIPVSSLLKVLPAMKIKKVKSGHIIFNEGDIDTNVYILMSGYLKTYFKEGENEIVTLFFSRGDIISTAPTKYYEGKAWVTLQAISDVIIIYLTKETYLSLFKKNKMMFSLTSESLKKSILLHRLKLENIMVNTAAERYQDFVLNHQHVLPHLSVKDMAAYLNLSRETISRLRNAELKKVKKNSTL